MALGRWEAIQSFFDDLADEHFGDFANAAKTGAKLVGPSAAALGTTVGGFTGLGTLGLPGAIVGSAGGAAVGAVVGSAAGAIVGVALEKASLVLTGEPAFAPDATFP